MGKPVIAEIRHGPAAAVSADLVAVHVFHDDVQTVESGTHGQGLPVKRGVVDFPLHQLRRDVAPHSIFKSLHGPAGKGAELSENVQHGALQAVLVDPGYGVHRDLQGDGHQDGVRSEFHEIHAHVKREQVVTYFVGDDLVQILELDRRRSVQLGERLKAVKLLGLQVLVEGACSKALNAAETVGLVG